MRDGVTAPENKIVGVDEPKPLLRNWNFQKALVADPELTGDAKSVAFVLLDHHNHEDGYARPGQARIAREAGIGLSTVKRAVARLKARGWFCVAPTVDPQGDPGVNRYYPIWKRAEADGVESSGQHHKPGVATKPKSKAPAEPVASATAVAFQAGPIRLEHDEVAELRSRIGPDADRLLDKLRDGEIGSHWTPENWRKLLAAEVNEWDMPF